MSNLAFKDMSWPAALEGLRRTPIQGLEIAPSLIWERPELAPPSHRLEFRRMIEDQGLQIAGIQSLMFNRDDLQMFGGIASRSHCVTHLKKMIDLCRDLGGGVVGFASFKNRKLLGLSAEEAREISLPFFGELADHAENSGVVFCLEPVSAAFGCDFITDHQQALDLIRYLSHQSFKLLWDSGTACSSGEDLVESFHGARAWIGHVHVNDPFLKPPSPANAQHRHLAEYLHGTVWSRWVSLEFLSEEDVFSEASHGMHVYAH